MAWTRTIERLARWLTVAGLIFFAGQALALDADKLAGEWKGSDKKTYRITANGGIVRLFRPVGSVLGGTRVYTGRFAESGFELTSTPRTIGEINRKIPAAIRRELIRLGASYGAKIKIADKGRKLIIQYITVTVTYTSADKTKIKSLKKSTGRKVTLTRVVGANLAVAGPFAPEGATLKPPRVGVRQTYIFTVKNDGPDTAQRLGVLIWEGGGQPFDYMNRNAPFAAFNGGWSVDLAAGGCDDVAGTLSCDATFLESGDTMTITMDITPTQAAEGKDIFITVDAKSDTTDKDKSNNKVEYTARVGPKPPPAAADIAIVELRVSSTGARAGAPRVNRIKTYILEIVNNGPEPARDATVEIREGVPSGGPSRVEITGGRVDGAGRRGPCTVSGGRMNCMLGDLASGGRARIAFSIRPGTTVAGLQMILNMTAKTRTHDPRPANNTKIHRETVAGFTIAKLDHPKWLVTSFGVASNWGAISLRIRGIPAYPVALSLTPVGCPAGWRCPTSRDSIAAGRTFRGERYLRCNGKPTDLVRAPKSFSYDLMLVDRDDNRALRRVTLLCVASRSHSIVGEWRTNHGTLRIGGGHQGRARGTYGPGGNGELFGTLRGQVFSGTWRQRYDGGHRCAKPYRVDASASTHHWGKFTFRFDKDFTRLAGQRMYCADPGSDAWTGTRVR
ncbi:MAG: hypothetical protein V3S44_10475 [Alphaproteobacteria bacterium]